MCRYRRSLLLNHLNMFIYEWVFFYFKMLRFSQFKYKFYFHYYVFFNRFQKGIGSLFVRYEFLNFLSSLYYLPNVSLQNKYFFFLNNRKCDPWWCHYWTNKKILRKKHFFRVILCAYHVQMKPGLETIKYKKQFL